MFSITSTMCIFFCLFSSQLCDAAQKWANHLAAMNEFYYRPAKTLGQNLFCCPCSALVTDLTGRNRPKSTVKTTPIIFDNFFLPFLNYRSRGGFLLVQHRSSLQLFQRCRSATYECQCWTFYTNGMVENEILWHRKSHITNGQNICCGILLSNG